jgi:predicted transcriptional regulator
VNSVNVTVRFNEEELRKLDELAQRMGKTRSDVIRDLITRFDEVLREEVERERKRWMAIGFVGALESAVLDPEVVLRFVRRNVDVLGYPDFLIGMTKVRNRVVVFSHHDKIGHQLLQQVKSKVEEDIKREEAEIEREEDDEGDVGVSGSAPVHVYVRASAPSRILRAAPTPTRYKSVGSGGGAPPIPRPAAVSAVDKPVIKGERGSAKAAATATAPEKQKLVSTSSPTTHNSAATQAKAPNPQTSGSSSGKDAPSPVGQGANHGLSGDFVLSLITHSYHKYRSELLRLVESVIGG